MSDPVKITVSGVLADLTNGYTRTKDDTNYQGDGKSIQEKYGINKSDVARLFAHDKLKGRKTIGAKKPTFILEDDTDENGAQTTSEADVPEAEPVAVEEVSADASTDSKEEEDPAWMAEDTAS
jgi:hypothetical protein